jgi:hypothetical protein
MTKEYIVIRDGFWRGIIGDLFMYGCLLGLYTVNYRFLGNNGVLNVIFTVLAIFMIVSIVGAKHTHKFVSKADAIKYLESIED